MVSLGGRGARLIKHIFQSDVSRDPTVPKQFLRAVIVKRPEERAAKSAVWVVIPSFSGKSSFVCSPQILLLLPWSWAGIDRPMNAPPLPASASEPRTATDLHKEAPMERFTTVWNKGNGPCIPYQAPKLVELSGPLPNFNIVACDRSVCV